MAFVEGDRMAGHKAAHDIAQRCLAGAKQQVKMVWNERPGVALGLSFLKDQSKTFQEGLAVLVIFEDLFTFNPSSHYML